MSVVSLVVFSDDLFTPALLERLNGIRDTVQHIDCMHCGRVLTLSKGFFSDCPQLRSVVLPPNIHYIGDHTFTGTQLTTIHLPSSVTEISGLGLSGIATDETILVFEAVHSKLRYAGISLPKNIHIPTNGTHHDTLHAIFRHSWPVVTGSVGGDPIMRAFDGSYLKFPNHYGIYRLFELGGVVVNIEVDRLSILPMLTHALLPHGLMEPTSGYYVTNLYVRCSVGTQGISGISEYNLSLVCPNQLDQPAPWVTTTQTGQSTHGLFLGPYRHRLMALGDIGTLEIRIYANTQIRNQILIHIYKGTATTCPSPRGCLVSNYRLKDFIVDRTNNTRSVRGDVAPRLCTKAITSKHEVSESVLYPGLFLPMFLTT